MRTCEHFTSINLLRALFPLFCEHQHCEQWQALPSIGEDPHARCTILAACALYAHCKLSSSFGNHFYRTHIFIRVAYIWCPYAFLSNSPLNDPLLYYSCMPFKPSDALHSDLGFCLPNLVVTGHFEDIWPLIDPSFTPASFLTPAMNYTLIRGSFDHIWWP